MPPCACHMPASKSSFKGHADWIQRKRAQLRASPQPPQKQFVDGETFLYLGRDYPLTITARQSQALLFDGVRFSLAGSAVSKSLQVFIRWYKLHALQVISDRVSFYARLHKLNYQKIRISSARTRWGSCSARGTLSFSWKLIMAPIEIIDYVVVHELVHTQIKNHSRTFWSRMEALMPGYKPLVAWLKKNGHKLTLGDDH